MLLALVSIIQNYCPGQATLDNLIQAGKKTSLWVLLTDTGLTGAHFCSCGQKKGRDRKEAEKKARNEIFFELSNHEKP